MTKTESRRRKVVMPFDIRKKFAAATAMLLVAVIMMVSSTYAWFTLSTAPEVKGIQTSVGANGNLEIALLNGSALFSNAADLGIITGIGDSMAIQGKDKKESNATWGNLIDLADEYGLDTVAFLPSALNIAGNETDGYTIDGSNLLLAPTYGSDGRVISVDQQTRIGKKEGNLIMPYSETVVRNGVGIIGVASTMSVRLQQYQDARTAALTAINSAVSEASSALSDNATELSAILLKAARGDPATTRFTKAEMQTLGAVIGDLETANGHVWEAIKQIAVMSTIGADGPAAIDSLDDDDLLDLVDDINGATTPAELAAITNVRITTELQDAIDNYTTTVTDINAAETRYGSGEGNLNVEGSADNATFSYSEAKLLINQIINNANVTVNGIIATGDHKEEMQNSVDIYATIPVDIKLNTGSGIFYDIAKSAGNFSTTTQLSASDVGYNGIGSTAILTRIGTNAEPPILLPTARENAGEGHTGGGSTGNIVDTYGYAIDFGFRTNAATGAKLLLQGNEELQRIYGDSNNESTKGEGTFVKFQSSDLSKFSLDDVVALVSALRIVFVEPVLTENQTTNETTVSYSVLTVAAPEIGVTVNADGSKTYDDSKVTKADENEDGTEDTVIVPIALYGYTVADAADGGKIVTLGDKKVDATDNTVNDLELLTLTQNVAQKLSAIVYLDGDAVDNTMVANAETSMTGTINFQFKTDAELVPMENPELRNGTNNSQSNTPVVTKDQLNAGITAVAASQAYGEEETTGACHVALAAAQTIYYKADATNEEIYNAARSLAVAYATLDRQGAAAIATAMGVTLP